MDVNQQLTAEHTRDIEAGERFEFGRNWSEFLRLLNQDRIDSAEKSLQQMLGMKNLEGRSFVDIGSGSGLFSLAARNLGARVHSFDYDPYSVASTTELKRRYHPTDPDWKVEHGSALDQAYLKSLGQFDIVYSWGVLHHTGSMWPALENVAPMVRSGGTLFIAIYNDQGKRSRRWLAVKKAYNGLPPKLRFLVLWPTFVKMWWRRLLKDVLVGKPGRSFREVGRGMSLWHDVVDWVGGYPFEVAKPEEIFNFYRDRGFQLVRMTTQGGDLGCNEFVFLKAVKAAETKPGAPVPVMLMIRELGIGGSERQMSVVARSLDRSRFEPHVGCFRPDGLRRKELDEAGVPVVQFRVTSFKSPEVITGAIAMHRYIRRHGIRLVHSFDLPTCLFAIPALAVFRSAIPVSSLRFHRELISRSELRLMRITDKLTRAVVVNSQQLRRHVIEDEGVPSERVLLCYNGIDLELFRPPCQSGTKQPELKGAALVIGVVCALRPEKDLGTLVRAFALLLGMRQGMKPGVRLVIVGDGPCKEELQRLAAELGIGSEVVFIPATRTVVPWLHSIDIFVLPSTSEALSNSLMEAMACGCAVVASKVGGNPELVEHEVTGLLFSSRQPDELAGCLVRLTDSPDLRRRFSQAATEFIHNKFSIPASAARMGEIYEQLLASVKLP